MADQEPELFRVSVYVDTEKQRDAAAERLRAIKPDWVSVYKDSVDGWANEEAVSDLRRQGFTIYRRRLDPAETRGAEAAAAEAPARRPRRRPRVNEDLRRRVVGRLKETADEKMADLGIESSSLTLASGGAGAAPAEGMYKARLRGPIRSEWRQRFSELGVHCTSFIPPDIYVMHLDAARLARVRELDFVLDVSEYDVEDTVSPDLVEMIAAAAAGPPQEAAAVSVEASAGAASDDAPDVGSVCAAVPTAATVGPAAMARAAGLQVGAGAGERPASYDVILHRKRDLNRVSDIAERAGIVVEEKVGAALRIEAPEDEGLLGMLAGLWQVKLVAPHLKRKLFVDFCAQTVGLSAVNQGRQTPWAGRGVTVCIFDSGVDNTHPSLTRVERTAVPGATEDDLIGHGSHVAGIIGGTGALPADTDGLQIQNGQPLRGIAPEARLVSVGIMNPNGEMIVPPDLKALLERALPFGPHIINLSWGGAVGGDYDQGSAQVDEFAYEHPDILVVVAAGNSGTARRGFPDPNSIGTPASAKNVLTVGASCTERPGIERTWADYNGDKFPLPPTSQQPMAGSADIVAANSSRGPTDLGAIKPEIVAPGTYILSARVKRPHPMLYWQPYDDLYAYTGGTSMAAPIVAGAAAVLREYLREERDTPAPSAALMKAILVASSRRMDFPQAPDVTAEVGYPDFDQGFGRLDLASVLPAHGSPVDRQIIFADVANDSDDALESRPPDDSSRRSARSYRFRVADAAAEPLRIALAWTDLPGRSVQNNLQIDVRLPDGKSLPGNADHRFMKNRFTDDRNADDLFFDARNTVELVRVENPPPGLYRVRVIAQNTFRPPQGYALCVCGQLASELTAV